MSSSGATTAGAWLPGAQPSEGTTTRARTTNPSASVGSNASATESADRSGRR